MITLLWRSDCHLADSPPQSRTDNWAISILGKLIEMGSIARSVNADAVLDGGDFFHVKSPGQNTHELVQRAAAVHQAYPCPTFATLGNHDMKYGSQEFLHESPLGVLFSTGSFQRLYDDYEVYFGSPEKNSNDVRVYPYDRNKDIWTRGNPFPRKREPVVRVVGVPYHGNHYDMNRFTTLVKGEEDYLVAVVHCAAGPEGGTMFDKEDVLSYLDLANMAPDVWCFLPGTKIIDWNGRAFPIEEVRESMALAGRSGATSVEKVHPVRHIDENVIALDVEGVPGDLIPGVTQEHPFWVAKGLRCRLPSRAARRCHPDKPTGSYPCSTCHNSPVVSPRWCPAGDIEAGDYMAVPVPRRAGGLSEPGLARLLGLYVAEGHLLENRKKEPVAGVGWSFHENETRLHGDVRALVEEHFGLKTHDHFGSTGCCLQICAYGSEAAEFFLTHGGRHAENKCLSSWVWGLSPASQMELLLGWLDGDGHARNPERYDRTKAEVMGATASPQLATQMFLLALSVGLRPYYSIRPERQVTFPNGHVSEALPCHCLSFYGEDAVLLANRMGVEIPRPSKTKVAGFFADGLYWVRVRGVSQKHYKGPVYNMRTSTEEYVAGLLLTHNCFGHWHIDQGIQKVGQKVFVNVGSVSRGALVQDNLERIPACVSVMFTDEGVTTIRNPLTVEPAKDVFDLVGKARAEGRELAIESFVESLQESLMAGQGETVQQKVEGLDDIPDKVRERTLLYLERAGA